MKEEKKIEENSAKKKLSEEESIKSQPTKEESSKEKNGIQEPSKKEISKDKFDRIWRQIEFSVDLYKFYFDIFLKFNLFYYALTSGIVAYAVTNPQGEYINKLLYIPICIGFSFVFIGVYGTALIKNIGEHLRALSKELDYEYYPDTSVLILLAYLAILIYSLVSFGIINHLLT